MPGSQPNLLIEDIIESSHKMPGYTIGMTFEGFACESKTIDAIIRDFEIIGEAANRLHRNLNKHIQV